MLRNSNKTMPRWLRIIPPITWVLFGLLVVFSALASYFATASNVFNLIRQGAVLILVTMGMMVVVASGSIDLAVGSLVGLSGVVTAFILKRGLAWPLAVLIAVLTCSLAGLISGSIIAKGRIFPFVVTFGMLFIIRSLSLGISQRGSIHINNRNFSLINEGYLLHLPIPFWVTVVLILIVLFLLERTPFGRYVLSIGHDPTCASWMGINVDLYRVLTHILSATLAGVAGVLLASRLNTGNALVGEGTEFSAIAATVLGGTPLTGGQGNLAGAIIGALIITVLQNGLTMLGLTSEKISAIVGVVVMLGVIVAQSVYRGGLRERE